MKQKDSGSLGRVILIVLYKLNFKIGEAYVGAGKVGRMEEWSGCRGMGK